jgi:hypothetical protein
VENDWKYLELEENFKEEWSIYTGVLSSNFILLDEEKIDTLIWERNEKTGNYTTKRGYHLIASREFEGKNKWWWPFLWV